MAAAHDPDFERLCDAARASVREVTVDEVRQRQVAGDDFVLLDVREDREFTVDRCAGARHLGRGVLERDIAATVTSKDVDLVLYCGGGYRSALAAESLQKMGYSRVSSMAGGIRAWRDAGLPVESGNDD